MYMCLGRRPIPKGTEIARTYPREVRKVALGSSAADARRHTFASLRAPAARASIYLFILFRELPLMTPAHLAEPLPASAVPA